MTLDRLTFVSVSVNEGTGLVSDSRALSSFHVAFAERGSAEQQAPQPQRLSQLMVCCSDLDRVCSLFVTEGKSRWLMNNCSRGRGGVVKAASESGWDTHVPPR